MGQRTTIALDIMSGDCSPHSRIRAAQKALQRHPDLHLILVGQAREIRELLAGQDASRITVIQSGPSVTMEDRPSVALRRKQDSSMWLAVEQVSMGVAQGCVSAGNTGALMAMGRHLLKTFPGIDRPAIAGKLPSSSGFSLMLDLGANIDCSSDLLHQFAVLGSLMMSEVYEVEQPRVALLNVGEEEQKGNERVKLAQQLISEDPCLNYCGFVEGDSLFSGAADVIVCDGFPGNVAIKTSEGVARYVIRRMTDASELNVWQRLLALLARPVLRILVNNLNPDRFNGATLLGLQGVVVKSHGGSTSEQFGYAIDQAILAVEHDAVARINDRLEDVL